MSSECGQLQYNYQGSNTAVGIIAGIFGMCHKDILGRYENTTRINVNETMEMAWAVVTTPDRISSFGRCPRRRIAVGLYTG